MQLTTPSIYIGKSQEVRVVQISTPPQRGHKTMNQNLIEFIVYLLLKIEKPLKIIVLIISIVGICMIYQSAKLYPIYKLQKRTQSEARVIKSLRQKALQRLNRPQVKKQTKSIAEFMVDAIKYLQNEAVQYIDIDKYKDQFKQLPFCVILTITQRTKNNEKFIIDSILKQNYSNFELKIISDQANYQRIDQANRGMIEKITHNYTGFYQLIKRQCTQNSPVVIVDHPLKPNALSILNDIYQRNNVWIIYQTDLYDNQQRQKVTKLNLGVISFYQRVFQLISYNDFQNDNSQYYIQPFSDIGKGFMTMALIEFSAQHAYNIYLNKSQILPNNQGSFYFNFDFKEPIYHTTNLTRTPFQPLDGLSQEFWINIPQLNYEFFDFLKDDFYIYDRQRQKKRSGFANIGRILKTMQYQQLMYLPLNHSVGLRQIKQVGKQYPIVASAQHPEPEKTRFCVTILSHNNVQNNRYLRVIKSILQQNYSNYHIVFIDDVSTDQNMKKTIQYAKWRDFSSITFVQNKQRKYGTYNIINAACTFCKSNQVQLLVDGDDELVGRQIFKIFNRAYINNQNYWVIFSNYRNSHYVYGDSGPYPSYDYLHFWIINRRKYEHMLSPIRSWKVQIIRYIPREAHFVYGNWFDTGYDDALQYPLFQLAGVDRIHYMKQILYLANRAYGDNDDSNQEKVQHRVDVLINHMLKWTPYKRLDSLPTVPDKDVMETLQKDQKQGKFVVLS